MPASLVQQFRIEKEGTRDGWYYESLFNGFVIKERKGVEPSQ